MNTLPMKLPVIKEQLTYNVIISDTLDQTDLLAFFNNLKKLKSYKEKAYYYCYI